MNFSNQPKIIIRPTTLDRLMDILSVLLLVSMWIYTFFQYSQLPEKIPIHFNLKNEVDGWGNRNSIFILPIISFFQTIGLIILNYFPHTFNYPIQITEENAQKQYRLATQLIRQLNLFITFVFAVGVYEIVETATLKTSPFGSWFVPVFIGLIFLPIVIYFIRARRIK